MLTPMVAFAIVVAVILFGLSVFMLVDYTKYGGTYGRKRS